MTYVLFLIGLVALFFGGELLVRGASAVARHFRLSPMVIGLTTVGFGTSAPELLVSVQAAFAGQPSIAVGNVLGSNISNVLLILGFSAALAPLVIHPQGLLRDFGFMLGSTALVWMMLAGGFITRLEGLLLLAGLAAFVIMALKTGEAHPADGPSLPQAKAWACAAGGLGLLMLGAHWLVDSATVIARAFGVSEAVIGLTVVAVGTSLPEMATSVVATIRRQTEIAVGNIVGSNIFNILGILGATAAIAPTPVEPRFVGVDMFWVAGSALLLTLAAVVLKGVPRALGGAFLATYAVYVFLMM